MVDVINLVTRKVFTIVLSSILPNPRYLLQMKKIDPRMFYTCDFNEIKLYLKRTLKFLQLSQVIEYSNVDNINQRVLDNVHIVDKTLLVNYAKAPTEKKVILTANLTTAFFVGGRPLQDITDNSRNTTFIAISEHI